MKTAVCVWDGKSVDITEAMSCLTEIGISYDPMPLNNTCDAKRVIDALADYDYVIAAGEIYNSETIPFLPKLKFIVRFGVGYERVDLDLAAREGIAVGNVPGVNAGSVAEHALAMMIALAREFTFYTELIKGGGYGMYYLHGSLDGTVGIMGFGAIARKLAHYLSVFDVKVIAYDPFVSAEVMSTFGVEKCDLDTLNRKSDFISLHMPCTPQTEHIVDREFISRMKPGSFLVDCARGKLVDEEAICDALESGQLRGAGFDVFEQEPLPVNSRLRKQGNVILTPHNSPASWRCYYDVMKICAESIRAFHEGRPIFSLLNKDYIANVGKRK